MAVERNDFIRDIIDADLAAKRYVNIATRFPPEPNGYLHIGHAKSICLNFGIGQDYGGTCNLRYDDTNPTKEDVEYVESIEHDVRWLGFAPSQVLFSADYFARMYELAERLVREGKAYVCDLTEEQTREYRGSLSEPGRASPNRDRSVDENLDLLRRMKAGEFPDGARTLRAKIDMASANMKMRDPLLYRIRHAHHHRSGDQWCIYPMYDWAHPLEDAIESISHSICTLEFENNREVYDWVIDNTGPWPVRPHQYEFARLALEYTVMSKRKLLTLVKDGHVAGWDDPRMPTIAGMRRRGISPEALRAFAEMIGVAKANSMVDIGKLEYCMRDDLNTHAPRLMGVLDPLEVEITGLDAGVSDAPLFPPDVGKPGTRKLAISSKIYIDRSDWSDAPEKGYKRLAPGQAARLRHGPVITAEMVDGKLRATVTPDAKTKGVIHWVDAASSVAAEVRLYDRLFSVPHPEEGGGDFLVHLNPKSLVTTTARLEAEFATAAPGSRWQLERVGYFVVDQESKPGAIVLNRIITLATQAEVVAAAEPAEKKENKKAATRPKSKSPTEYRAEARNRDAELMKGYEAALARGLTPEQADLLSENTQYIMALAAAKETELAANLLINEVPRYLGEKNEFLKHLESTKFGSLVTFAFENGSAAGKKAVAELMQTGDFSREVLSVDLGPVIDRVIASNPDKASQYRAGKTGLLGFFVGQVMKDAGGADPKAVNQAVRERLGV